MHFKRPQSETASFPILTYPFTSNRSSGSLRSSTLDNSVSGNVNSLNGMSVKVRYIN